MIRRPPRSTLDRSSAASDVYKRQELLISAKHDKYSNASWTKIYSGVPTDFIENGLLTVSYTHLRAHETVLDIVCRLLLEKKKLRCNKKCELETVTN